MKKYVYSFGASTDGDGKMKDILGGKGAGLAEMCRAGLPVPPGFTVSTEVCNIYFENGNKTPESGPIPRKNGNEAPESGPIPLPNRVTNSPGATAVERTIADPVIPVTPRQGAVDVGHASPTRISPVMPRNRPEPKNSYTSGWLGAVKTK